MIRFEKVLKAYGALEVLKGLDFSVDKGEVVSIIGPSGSGKTTVLRVLMTLEDIQGGTIYVDGEPLNRMDVNGQLVEASKAHVRRIRAKLGMVFQSFNLFPHMTALQNCIESPIYTQGQSKSESLDETTRNKNKVDLADKAC
ncbi:MAG: amino acid ABC transporter ATP-binding protein, partial [Boseongicola sp. SB0670_bin_30]|nr:amino acid ABC transporter ATP-binding protein [Boseongicola sp. SB0670_bin_30]